MRCQFRAVAREEAWLLEREENRTPICPHSLFPNPYNWPVSVTTMVCDVPHATCVMTTSFNQDTIVGSGTAGGSDPGGHTAASLNSPCAVSVGVRKPSCPHWSRPNVHNCPAIVQNAPCAPPHATPAGVSQPPPTIAVSVPFSIL
jgi:hypothetical protein